MAKVLSYMILVLLNVIMESLNLRKKKRELLNVTKVWLHVMLVLPNVTIELLNVTKN